MTELPIRVNCFPISNLALVADSASFSLLKTSNMNPWPHFKPFLVILVMLELPHLCCCICLFQMSWEFNVYFLDYNMIPCWNITVFLYIIRACLVVPWVSNDTIHNFITPNTNPWPHSKPFVVIVAILELPLLCYLFVWAFTRYEWSHIIPGDNQTSPKYFVVVGKRSQKEN